jgi:hypothetical protein
MYDGPEKDHFDQIPLLWIKPLAEDAKSFEYKRPIITDVKYKPTSFEDISWLKLPGKTIKNRFKASSFPLDFGFTGNHCLYRFSFTAIEGKELKLALSSRHRSTLFLNGVAFDGSITYSLQLFMPGISIILAYS